MAGTWCAVCSRVQRKRVFEPDQFDTGNLNRCLNRWDLTALGLGSTLGVGVYVLVGAVALQTAGPSIILSFLVAAVASLFAGLCYAELGARVPRAGSAYIYTYVTVGELVAFIIGWNMILEGLFGTASVARGLSTYIDSMSGGSMSAWFASWAPMSEANVFSSHFDLFAFLLVIALGVLLAFGVRESSMVNNVLAVLNMVVILFIVIAGAFKADASNWSIPANLIPPSNTTDYGTGGFFPYGIWGMLKGAAICFYGFVGFDTISVTGEEVRDPRRTIPSAILTVLVIDFVVYACVSTVVTMMVPYYLLDRVAAVATAFTYVEIEWARWIVSIGAVFGIFASLFGALFPLPRILYAMASDGLLIHWFAQVSENRKSPRIATLVPACLIAVLAACIELDQLILMMCIGTLLSYTVVATCVIILRYRSNHRPDNLSYLKQVFGCGTRKASRVSARIVDITLFLFIIVCVVEALIAVHVENPVIYVSVLHVVALVLLLILVLQPQVKEELVFKTPLVPIIPCLSIYVNIHLMILVNIQTWIRIAIWVAIGLTIYILCICCYRRHSNLEENIKAFAHNNKNGKAPVQIIVESPTPPDTMKQISDNGGDQPNDQMEAGTEMQERVVRNYAIPLKTDEIIVQQAVVENNEEKEAKIIDLLDQVLQAEEDTYEEIISLKEHKDDNSTPVTQDDHDPIDPIPHRKSLSELSDAGSDASLGNQVLSKYDVIAQVHREDLPKVNEEEEKYVKEEAAVDNEEVEVHEQVTSFNDSETNSQTDESGYSDTIDRNLLNDSTEDAREDVPYIPPPPPLDEKYFANPYFRKSYTLPPAPVKLKPVEVEEENKPRESVQSNNSQDDNNIVFGSDRQMSFMSKLNNIFQNKMSSEGEQQRRRSNSTGDMVDNKTFALNRERPAIFQDLKNELMSLQSVPNLRPVNTEEHKPDPPDDYDLDDDSGMNREDLRSKLENIFATGGPKPFKPRLMKSNPPTPEESYQTDSSTESLQKLPKMEKNDTLKRQKDKFGEVLNSFRLSLNKDDDV